MDFALEFIRLARTIGSFLCFQREEATFRIGTEYFPVCSGCFGIYLGAFAALCIFPFLTNSSRKLFSIRYGLPMMMPLVVYWITLNVQAHSRTWIIPGINEIYASFGVLFGATVSNAAYNLALETHYAKEISRIGSRFWLLAVALLLLALITFSSYQIEISVLFSASLLFVLGFLGLAGFFAVWVLISLVSHLGEKK